MSNSGNLQPGREGEAGEARKASHDGLGRAIFSSKSFFEEMT